MLYTILRKERTGKGVSGGVFSLSFTVVQWLFCLEDFWTCFSTRNALSLQYYEWEKASEQYQTEFKCAFEILHLINNAKVSKEFGNTSEQK